MRIDLHGYHIHSAWRHFNEQINEAYLSGHKKCHVIVNKKIIHEINQDVDFGMTVSGFVMYFIILTTGTVLYNGGIHQIDTVEQAAMALKPIAGNLAYLLFAIGVIGTGLIAIPVLSGSISYIFSETFGWEQGLDKKFHEAKGFYVIIAISLILGLAFSSVGQTSMNTMNTRAKFKATYIVNFAGHFVQHLQVIYRP